MRWTHGGATGSRSERRRWGARRSPPKLSLGCWPEAVGAPVPYAAFCDDPNERAWLSGWVTDAKHWSAGTAGVIRNPAAAAAIMALDAVVLNEARHAGNLLLVPDPDGGSAVVAIDADEALIGHPADLASRGLVAPDPRILARGFPPAGWRPLAMAAAEKLAAVPPPDLRAFAAEACAIAREPDPTGMAEVLIARCEFAVRLTRGYMDLVEARR